MADATALSVILDPLKLIFSFLWSIHWSYTISWILHVLITLPIRVLAVPLRFLGSLLFVLLSPLLYILGYIYGWTTAVLALISSLQPLYTFFGIAATVGIITGLTLSFSSLIITSALGMQDTSSRPHPTRKPAGYLDDDRRDNGYTSDTEGDAYYEGEEDTPPSSSNEKEWQWLEPVPSRWRQAGGLLSETILEEDDDSEER